MSPEHVPNSTLLAWAIACVPGVAASVNTSTFRGFMRSTNGPRPCRAPAPSLIDAARRGAQPFGR